MNTIVGSLWRSNDTGLVSSPTTSLGTGRSTVERPLRLRFVLSEDKIEDAVALQLAGATMPARF
jgi:hypothetical protein